MLGFVCAGACSYGVQKVQPGFSLVSCHVPCRMPKGVPGMHVHQHATPTTAMCTCDGPGDVLQGSCCATVCSM